MELLGGSMQAHPGPPLWFTTSMYTMLFLAGLYSVALPLVPPTGFAGFVWLMAIGLTLPRSITPTLRHSASRAENAT
jgi:hypothetical protein